MALDPTSNDLAGSLLQNSEDIYDDDDDDDEPPMLLDMTDLDKDENEIIETNDSVTKPISNDPEENVDTTKEKRNICPVTIISGFLGSGKTTLIQYILQSPDHGKRIAVIENEFGDSDGTLSVESIIARDGNSSNGNNNNLSDLIELPNGCVCCTVKDDLVTTLENLLNKKRELDYILIEASGMANPGPIASVFWLDDALESQLRLDGIVTLVDAHFIRRHVRETEEASQQIAYADRILVNKTDLLDSDAERQTVLDLIRGIAPTAPIRMTTYSKVPDLDWILDKKSLFHNQEEQQQVNKNEVNWYCQPVTTAPIIDKFTHQHTSGISTITLSECGSVDLQKVDSWLAALLWPNQDESDDVLKARIQAYKPPSTNNGNNARHASTKNNGKREQEIFRIKGILSVYHDVIDEDDVNFVNSQTGLDNRRFIVQGVHDLWEIRPGGPDLDWDQTIQGALSSPQERSCKLVIIGRYLKPKELQIEFGKCFHS